VLRRLKGQLLAVLAMLGAIGRLRVSPRVCGAAAWQDAAPLTRLARRGAPGGVGTRNVPPVLDPASGGSNKEPPEFPFSFFLVFSLSTTPRQPRTGRGGSGRGWGSV
jgi:hypothetical protein